jgi:hypothetical protein
MTGAIGMNPNQNAEGQADADGWIAWSGGENPVPGQRIEYQIRGFSRPHTGEEQSDELDWRHGKNAPASHIIAYRIAKPQPLAKADERGPITHDLKCWPEPFAAVKARLKPWELRKNDRDYRVGDTLRQREWSPETEAYTGDTDEQVVTWALYGPAFGLPEGYVIMSIQPPAAKADEVGEAVERLAAIVSDAEIIRVHGHANFGSMTPREVVNDGVWKYSIGYNGGHTQLCILLEHGLICKPRPGRYDASLTKKGKRYARALYQVEKASQASEIARLKAREAALMEGLRPFAEHSISYVEAAPDTLAVPITVLVGSLRRARTLTQGDSHER